MSDTDDTDLLLLIPPDFFLVHSPDLDIDSDCEDNFGFVHDEVKDSIVSDLITQVNDLESRICMIENLERSGTRSSTFNEDSFIDQSINSLTESDILRSQNKEKSGFLPIRDLNDPSMFQLSDHNLGSNSKLNLKQNSLDLETNFKLTPLDKESSKTDNLVTVNPPFNETGDRVKEYLKSDVQLSKRNQAKLLQEVDSFLEVKCKRFNSLSKKNEANTKNIESNSQVISAIDNALTTNPDEGCLVENNLQHKTAEEYQNLEQSLALPEVYQLLKEMEDTQSEMEKKLKSRDMQLHLHGQATNSCRTSITRPLGNSLGLEDLYTNPIINKQPENMFERLKNVQENKHQITDHYKSSSNPQMNYLFTSTLPVTNEELSYYRDSKLRAVSPKRTSVAYNPIDIVKANLPSNDGKGNSSQTGENKESPRRITSFRRHLNFDRSNLSPSASKSRPLIENQQGDEMTNVQLSTRINSRSNHSIKEKLNSLAMQRSTNAEKVNQNACFAVDNNPSNNAVLQQKISSNKLLSLSELWNKEPTFYSDDPNKLRQKLEEEKYRRQHCEQQIQLLQLRVLEEQEKLAVAIKVDQEKDKAILQITESWRKLNDHWSELEDQRHNLAQQLQTVKESAKVQIDELNKKAERWEKEVSQALDLAADYKEKREDIQKQMESIKRETEEKLAEANTQLDSLKEENEHINNENNNLTHQVKASQERIKEVEELLSKLKIELEKSKNQLSEHEAEVSVLKEQKESLISKIKDEKNRSSILEQHKLDLQQAVSEATKREKAAQDEARVSNERIEVARTELRALYQGQLETVVKEKLKEFQAQLEAAEEALKGELHSKEKQWAEKANDQYKQLREKYKIDLLRIEESHRQEINKWKSKLMESERLRSISESRLQEETNRRADIAHKLHSVMETQWREALNIISNPMQNVYEMSKDENKSRWPSKEPSSERLKGNGDMRVSRSNSTSSLAQTDEVPFCKEGLITYRMPQPPQDHQLKKYIQMLLERGPGNPIPQNDTTQESLEHTFSPESSLFNNKYLLDEAKKSSEANERLVNSSKPPWK